jgi:Flp pilus assembly protein TadD
LRELGDQANSVAAFDKALEIAPRDADVWIKRGIAMHEFERYSDAVVSFDKALRIDPNHEEAKRWRERSFKRMQEGG